MNVTRAGLPAPKIDWSFVSGFFDGEGAIHVSAVPGSSLLSLKMTICQKSVQVLQAIKALLVLSGVYSVIHRFGNGMFSLEVIRIGDMTQFLRSLKCVVKKRQICASLKYLEGSITGNALLHVFAEENMLGRRKTNPLRKLGPRFPLTRKRALKVSAVASTKARIEGNRRAFRRRIERRVLSLPMVFEVRDIERIIGVSKPRAQVLGNLFVREGLVKSRFERVPPRFRKKVFERL